MTKIKSAFLTFVNALPLRQWHSNTRIGRPTMRRRPERERQLDVSEIDDAARQCIRRFGVEAADQARLRAEEMRDSGDREGFELWMAIHRRVAALLPPGHIRRGQPPVQ